MRDSRCMTLSYARRLQWRRLMTAASRAAGAAGVLIDGAPARSDRRVLCARQSQAR